MVDFKKLLDEQERKKKNKEVSGIKGFRTNLIGVDEMPIKNQFNWRNINMCEFIKPIGPDHYLSCGNRIERIKRLKTWKFINLPICPICEHEILGEYYYQNGKKDLRFHNDCHFFKINVGKSYKMRFFDSTFLQVLIKERRESWYNYLEEVRESNR